MKDKKKFSSSVTITDIANYTGVSAMTVSRVINNSGYVSASTRKQVEKAISDLNYHPNLLARSLIHQKSSFIYVIVPDISNPFYAELTKGVEHIAHRKGYQIILSNAYRKQSLECEHLEIAWGRKADGIILVLPKLGEQKIAKFGKISPLVVVDKFIRKKNIDKVYILQDKGAFSAVEHLIALGHKRIAFLSGPKDIYNSISRLQGYKDAFAEYNLPLDEKVIIEGDFSFESGESAFYTLMDLNLKDRPTALFAANDLMALGFMRSAFKNSVNIPTDFSLVGFDDIPLASRINPPLTTIRHPYIEMGEEAMRLLLNKLESKDEYHPRTLTNDLVIRETTQSCG